MIIYVHFSEIPKDMTLTQVELGLAEALDEDGIVIGSALQNSKGRIDIELKDEDDNANPKYAQLTVKSYLQSIQFPKSTNIEIGGMEISLYA